MRDRRACADRRRQLADTHTPDRPRACPTGVSEQLHKTIVGGAAHAVFNGKIFVRAGAQLTDSAQQSRNLLLSERAHRHQAAARDLRRRREVRARRDGRPARRRAAVLPQEPRAAGERARNCSPTRSPPRSIERIPVRRSLRSSSARCSSRPRSRNPYERSPSIQPAQPSRSRRLAARRGAHPRGFSDPRAAQVNGKPLVFLDNAASSQMPRPVIDAGALPDERAREHPPRRALPVRDRHRGVRGRAPQGAALHQRARGARDHLHQRHHRRINLVMHGYGASSSAPATRSSSPTLEHHSNIVPWQMLARRRARSSA
jgi:hypothetical protein